MAPSDSEPAFRIVREIGRGGMGVVYEAVDTSSRRRVALKVLPQELRSSDRAFARFRREAQLAASISHPNCVFVYGVHDVDGSPAISMELMTGETLDDRRKRQPPTIDEAIRLTLDVLEGLVATHDAGIIHRDVKPSNIFFTENGRTKIGDFGLSRTLEVDARLTRTGAFVGSPAYASPEQARGGDVDQRTDVYSIGATLYTLLTGVIPFVGPDENISCSSDVLASGHLTAQQLLARVLSEQLIPPSRHRSEVPRDLERIVLRAMAREPRRRYSSARAMANALRRLQPSQSIPLGMGSRFGAFVVDSTAIVFLAGIGSSALPNEGLVYVAVFFLYFASFEVTWGASPGKMLFRARLASTRGTALPRTAVLIRCAGATALFVVGLLSFWISAVPMRRTNRYRTIHDLISGAVVIRTAAEPASGGSRILSPERATPSADEVPDGMRPVAEILAWKTQTVRAAHEPGLDRLVWIHAWSDPNASDAPEGVASPNRDESGARRVASSDPHLHWLSRSRTADLVHDVYEGLGGASLLEYERSGVHLPWLTARTALIDLAEFLETSDRQLAVSQLWIDERGRLRVLPFCVSSTSPDADRVDDMALLAVAARCLLGVRNGGGPLPNDLPLHAETTVDRIASETASYAAPEEVAIALRKTEAISEARLALRQRRRLVIETLTIGGPVAILCGLLALADYGKLGLFVRTYLTLSVGGLWLVAGLATFLAIAFRGGITMEALGLGIRRTGGRAASRLRCGIRAALGWVPAAVLLALLMPTLPDMWGREQVLGPPNAAPGTDDPMAWAPSSETSDSEWLELGFPDGSSADSITIFESYNPGAIVEVTAADGDARRTVVWRSGDEDRSDNPHILVCRLDQTTPITSLRIELDPSAVEGWNEIDAVALVHGREMTWATTASASSQFDGGDASAPIPEQKTERRAPLLLLLAVGYVLVEALGGLTPRHSPRDRVVGTEVVPR